MNTTQHKSPSLGQRIREFLATIFTLEFWRGIRRDLREIYTFYLDDDSRRELAQMGIIRRAFRITIRILGALFSKLTPVRQALLFLALVLFFFPRTEWQGDGGSFAMTWSPVGFTILLFILLLELKDKLLAKDELQAGHSVQEALMPREMPVLEGWDIWLFTTPANDVGGDLVDYLTIGSDGLDLTLADVAGKGLGAALLAAKLQATLRAIAPESRSLTEIAERVNAILCRDGLPSRFATLAYARLHAGSSGVKILNAGHLPPLILRKSSIEQLQHVAPAIGLTSQARFVEQKATIRSGEYLVLASDGILEARSELDSFFGEERFHQLIEGLRGMSAESMGKEIMKSVEEFTARASRSDDISLVIAGKI